MYFAYVMGLTNNILRNVIRGFFRHLPQGGEENNSRVKVTKCNQQMGQIKLDQRIELIKSNQ